VPINLLTFAITRYRRDFRKYLMRAAERSGGSALHVLFREKVTFSWADAERVDYSTSANSYALGQIIRERLQPGPILGLLGLGGTRLEAYPVVPGSSICSGCTGLMGWFGSAPSAGGAPSCRIPVAVLRRRGLRLIVWTPFRGLSRLTMSQ
jgi:hypothetical protein